MPDVVVTVPMALYEEWLEEGDLPGAPWSGYDSHFWFYGGAPFRMPNVRKGDRVYIVARGRLIGYAPLVAVEGQCRMRPERSCFLRRGGAVAVTIEERIPGFRGYRYRWWPREDERPLRGTEVARAAPKLAL